MRQRILITGGAGFVGSHLTELLLESGHQVVALDDLSTGSEANLARVAAHPNLTFIVEDANSQTAADQVAEADLVYHLAATVGVFNVMKSACQTVINNVDTTHHILEAAAKTKTRVVLASTSEVYGKGIKRPFHEDDDLLLGASSLPRWSYAVSKLVDEHLALGFHREREVPVVVVRLFNTIGPRQLGRYGMVVPRFIEQALAGEDITVYGDGEQSRCFAFVGDVVRWLSLLGLSEDACGRIYNLGNPQPISILGLAQHVIEACDSTSQIVYVPYEEAYGAGFEEMQSRVPDISRVVEQTGHTPQVSLAEAVTQTRDWIVARQAEEAVATGDGVNPS